MRKINIIAITAFLMLAFNVTLSAQNQLTTGRRPFVYLGSGYANTNTLLSGFSGELGVWGTTKVTSYSVTFDVVNQPSVNTSYWVGIKPYFTAFDNGKISYMLYFQPKFNVNNEGLNIKERLIEVGFNPNYTVSNNVLLGLTFGGQIDKTNAFYPFVGIGFIILK